MTNLIREIRKLSRTDQLKLLNILNENIKTKRIRKNTSLIELEGLGKEIWQDIDVKKYINKEHKSWK